MNRFRMGEINSNSLLPIFLCAVLVVMIAVRLIFGVTLVRWAMTPPFADLIGITGSVDCMRAGLDPYSNIQCDPWGRLYNYPRIWLTIFDFLDFDRRVTNPLGIALSFAFILAISSVFMIRRHGHSIFVLLLILSPPVLLLLERGNSDIIVFVLVVFAVFLARRIRGVGESAKLHLSYAAIVFASILKIYPVFLLLLILFEKASKRTRVIITTYSVIIIGGYFAYTLGDILSINHNTPRPSGLAYGKNVYLQTYFSGKTLFILTNSLMVIVAVVALRLCEKYQKKLVNMIPVSHAVNRHITLFLAGALIYCGTFFIGNNWDYRLVFLLLCVPYLLDIIDTVRSMLMSVSLRGMLLLVFYGSLMSDFVYTRYLVIPKEIASWGMLFVVTMISFFLFFNREKVIVSLTAPRGDF